MVLKPAMRKVYLAFEQTKFFMPFMTRLFSRILKKPLCLTKVID